MPRFTTPLAALLYVVGADLDTAFEVTVVSEGLKPQYAEHYAEDRAAILDLLAPDERAQVLSWFETGEYADELFEVTCADAEFGHYLVFYTQTGDIHRVYA